MNPTPRTLDEIVARIKSTGGPFNFSADVLLEYLPFDLAQPFLRPEVTREQWETSIGTFSGYGPPCDKSRPLDPADREHILEATRHYAKFGWEKVQDHRGLSASRTIDKMSAWLWLLGYEDGEVYDVDADWGQYGAGCLARICAELNFPIPSDNRIHRMIDGLACTPRCKEGCAVIHGGNYARTMES